jgi:pimeloyl-ACP methyl ester carboxylesterase
MPPGRLPDFDTQVEDVIAVLDAAGSERPAIVGTIDATLVAILLAAAHPERCDSLVLFAPTAKHELTSGVWRCQCASRRLNTIAAATTKACHILTPSRIRTRIVCVGRAPHHSFSRR